MSAGPRHGLPATAAVARWPLPAFPGAAAVAAMPAGARRIGVLSNANSGHTRRHLGRLSALADRYPHVVHLATAHGGEVQDALAEFARREIDVLAINGGDGTIARVLGEVLERRPFAGPLPVALLPGGTANMSSGRVGVRGGLLRAARRLFDWGGGEGSDCLSLERPLLRIRFADGRANAYGMFLGAGAVIQGTEYAHREVHGRGLRDNTGLAVAMARTVWGLRRGDPAFHRPVPLSLAVDGTEVLGDVSAAVLLVTSLDRLFLGLKPFWGSGDGPLCSTVIGSDAEGLLRGLPRLLAGRPGGSLCPARGYHSHRGRQLALAFDGTLTVDGELHPVVRRGGPVLIDHSPPFTFLRL